MKPLQGRVAVVAGATRGAGRGIARMLGEAGATVYCTGRGSRARASPTGRRETIEETAELVTAAGGTGICVRVDHAVDAEVAALFERVQQEANRLDLLVNVFTGPPASWRGLLQEKPADVRSFVEAWFWPRVVTAWHAAHLMAQGKSAKARSAKATSKKSKSTTTKATATKATTAKSTTGATATGTPGLIVELVEQDNVGYHGAFAFDLMETLLKRLIFALAHDLEPKGIAAVAVGPGFMRTEAILDGFGVTEANWRDALKQPRAAAYGWGGSETPCFVGRAVAALAADPRVMSKSGGIYTARELADEYGFMDLDGKRPDHDVLDAAVRKAMESGPLAALKRSVPHAWELVRRPQPE